MVPESPIAVPERELEFTRDAEKLISEYVSELTGAKMKLVDLIEKLGNYMIDPDEFRRYQGLYILSEVLDKLPSTLLSQNETSKLVDFFCERIKDHFMLLPVVLKGINALMNMENIHADCPMSILCKLSDDVVCQSLSQTNRFVYYSLFKSILQHHRESISDRSMEFIRYLVNSMDGESDPRNLMLLFRFIPNVLRQFTLNDVLTDEMFSVLECYFPVDFTPSSRFAISREDLKEGLEDCLTATPKFFPLCLPLILEKLDSKLKTALTDSLQLLMRQCRMWGGDSLKDHLSSLWSSVRELVFTCGDSHISDLAIQAFAISVSSCANSPSMKEPLQQCLETVSSNKTLLMDASLNLFPLAMKLQGALALSSPVPAEHIISNMLPHLLNLLEFEEQHKDVILSSLLPILSSSVNFDLWNYSSKAEVKNQLAKVPDFLFKYIEIIRLRAVCTQSFRILLPNLNRDQRLRLYSMLKTFKSSDAVISENEAKLIKDIAKLYPEEITTDLLETLPSGSTVEVHSRNVELLSWSCHIPSVTKYCCDKILCLLESNQFNDTTVEKLRLSCESMEDPEVLVSMGGDECQVIDRILTLVVNEKLEFTCKQILWSNLAKIFQCIVSPTKSSEQTSLVNRFLDKYFNKFTIDDQPLSELSSNIVLLEGVLAALHSDVVIPRLESLVRSLMSVSLNAEDDDIRTCASRLIASIFNKHQNDKLLEETIAGVNSEIDSYASVDKGRNAVALASWICKALVLSNHPLHSPSIHKLLSVLSSKELCMSVANGFKIILTESDDYLNRQCHAKIGILYKQRVFENVSKLIDLQDSVEGVCHSAVNLTIAYFLKYSPPQLVIIRLKELMKIIVRCLESEDSNVSLSTLEVVASLLATKNVIFEDYTSLFIPKCIYLSTSGPMDVRIAALDCLSLYSQFKDIVILPYQKQVISGLSKSLDDRKRLVRRKAVEARSRWFLVGAL